jgi:acylphosphatase
MSQDAAPSQCVRMLIHGKVQRVRFRLFIKRQADRHGLTGWVRNRRDNRVEVLAQGPRPDLDLFCQAVRKGPPNADVDQIETQWTEAPARLRGFRIRWFGFL